MPLIRIRTTMLAWLRRDLLALTLFVAAALFAMAPILSSPRDRVLGAEGDQELSVYITGWIAQALLLGESPLIDPRLNFPDDLVISTNDSPLIMIMLLAPVTWLMGPVFGYNMVIFLAHVLSGYFAYLWLYRLTGSRSGALIGGLTFLLSPFRIGRSFGHINIVSTQSLPLFFWALEATISERRPRESRLWMLAGAATFTGLLSLYHLVIALVAGTCYALARLGRRLPEFLIAGGWRAPLAVGLGVLITALPVAVAMGTGSYEPSSIGSTRAWSADWRNFLLPAPFHAFWGGQFWAGSSDLEIGEKFLYLGWVALPLAALGLGWLLRQPQRRPLALAWLATAAVGLILALGTDLHIDGQPLSRNSPFWLPAYYLGQLPMLGIVRSWSRFGEITVLFVALLAGIGATQIAQRAGRWALPGMALLGLLIIIDFWPLTSQTTTLRPRGVELWLAGQPGDFAVAMLPVDKPHLNDRTVIGSLFHGKQMPAYAHPRHLPPAYRQFQRTALELPDQEAIIALRRTGLRYLIFEIEQYNGWRVPRWDEIEPQLARSPLLEPVAVIDGFAIYAFR